jgi:hypothetical protein
MDSLNSTNVSACEAVCYSNCGDLGLPKCLRQLVLINSSAVNKKPAASDRATGRRP